MEVDRKRVKRIAEIIMRIGVEPLIRMEEEDPQFLSIEKVSRTHGEGKALVLTVLTSLVSYRLAMRGEVWWTCFSKYFTKKDIRDIDDVASKVINFINTCRGALVQREAKKRRILKVIRACKDLIEHLMKRPEEFPERYEELLRCESRSLGQPIQSKTLVFSIKMGYYAVRRIIKIPTRIYIPMPIDSRVACITFSSGMVKANSYKDLIKHPSPAQEAWREVSRLTNIPTIHLDVLAWRLGWIPRDLPIQRAQIKIMEVLRNYIEKEEAEIVAREFASLECR